MALFEKLDIWSINDMLDKIQTYEFEGNAKESQFYDYYSDQINELSCISADMWNELNQMKERFSYKLPFKNVEFYQEDEASNSTGCSWFNTAASALSECDMVTLLVNEDVYADSECEKDKRLKALKQLTKEQLLLLLVEVMNFITRYLELKSAFQEISSLIEELDYHNSFIINKDGKVTANESVYL